jgi:hypothetical protein
MKILISFIFLLFAISSLFAAEVSSFDKAKEMAAKLNKPVLIDFWSDN